MNWGDFFSNVFEGGIEFLTEKQKADAERAKAKALADAAKAKTGGGLPAWVLPVGIGLALLTVGAVVFSALRGK